MIRHGMLSDNDRAREMPSGKDSGLEPGWPVREIDINLSHLFVLAISCHFADENLKGK